MRKIILLCCVLLCTVVLHAQITGTKNIPGAYPDLLTAITDLNTQGVGAGGVTLNLLAGNAQTAPAGGYSITATGTLANPVIIQGNGNTVTASAALTAGNLNDAIFKIIGADYVTLSGFTLQENAGNTVTLAATNNMTEWGVALLYASATDGAQNNTITGNSISLNRTYTNTFGIYSNTRHTATAPTVTADITAATGANSNNKVYSNVISNVNMGITFIGSGTAANMDATNDIGGSSAGTGNTITNWGGAAAASAYVSNTATSYGIFLNHQVAFNISYNALTSANVSFSGTLIGIFADYVTASPTGTFTNNITNNTVTMTNSFVGTASQIHCIRNSNTAAVANANVTVNMNANKIQNCAITGVASAITLFGVLNTANFGTVNLNSNIVQGNTSSATTAGIVGITSQGAVVNAVNLNNNQCGTATGNFMTFSAATSGAVNAVTCSAAAATAAVSISNNDVRGIVFNTTSSSGPLFFSSSSTCLSHTINNNTFTNLSLNTTGGVTFISSSTTLAATGSRTVSNNAIVTAFNKTAAGGTITFFTSSSFSVTGSTNTFVNNNFSNITVTGATTIGGWSSSEGNTSTDAPAKTFTGNTFNNITGGTSAITIVSFSFGGTTNNISNNTITNVTGQSSISGLVLGSSNNGLTVANNIINNLISTGTGGTVTGLSTSASGPNGAAISLNKINTLSSTGASTVSGIIHSGGTSSNIFKNKIYDLQSNNAAGLTNGLTVSGGTAVNVYNNIIGDLRAIASTGANSINGLNLSGGTTVNGYYNTVNLTGTSTGTGFGSSAVFASSTPTVTLRNNIFVNNSVPTGAGIAAAYRRSTTTLTSYGATSNNNLFFAGGACASRVIFFDGTNSDQTLAAFKTRVTPRDAVSISEDPQFVSTTGSSASFLHINTAIATQIESGAATIATFTDDFDGDLRGATPDIGADEFTGIAATVCAGTPTAGTASAAVTTLCAGGATTICLAGQTAASGITVQWQSSVTNGGPYANVPCASGGNATCFNTGALTAGTYYYVAVVTCAASGLSATSNQVAITVNPTPTAVVTPAAPGVVCQGTPVTLVASGGTTYSWSPAAGLNTTTGATVIATPLVTTTYTVTVFDAIGCSSTKTVTVTVNPLPVVTATATPGTICVGATAQLNATLNTGVVPYLLSGLTGQTYTTLAGAGITVINTAAQLTPTFGSADQDDGGVVITLPFTFTYMGNTFTKMSMSTNGWVGAGDQGTIDAASSRASGNFFTTTIPNNTIAAWFKDMGANFPLGTGSMRHGLIGTDVYAFQWDKAVGSGFSDGSAILISFQVNIYGPASATPGRVETIYGPTVGAIAFASALGVEDGTGGTNHYINALDGTATSLITSTVWPGNGNGYRFDVPTYSWAPAATLSSTSVANPVATPLTTTTYTVTVTNPTTGCNSSAPVTVTVNIPPTVSNPASITSCAGSNASFTVTTTGNPAPTNQWEVSTDGGATWTPISGATTTTLTVTGVTTAMNGYQYHCVVTGSCVPATATSAAATLTVNPVPTVNAVSNQVLCSNTATVAIAFSGTVPGTVYNWINNTPSIGLAASGSGNIPSFTATNATAVPVIATITVTPTYTNAGTTCTGTPTTFTITVNPLVTIAESQVEPTTCVSNDGSITLVISGAAGPYTFAWTGTGVNPTAQNQTNLIAGVYNVTVTAGNGCQTSGVYILNGPGGCAICPVIGSVTTTPAPSGCIGSPITLTASGLTSMGITYGVIFKSYTAATANPYVGGTVLATVPNASLTAGGSVATGTTTFAAANNYFIYAILTPSPLDPTCRPSAVTNFVINPTPDAVAAPVSQTICSGTAITTIALSGTITGTTFNWTRNNTAAVTGITASGTGDISGTLTNTTTAPVTVTFTITPIANGCSGTPITATVLVNPTPTATATPASQTICSGAAITTIVNAGSGVTGTVYNWTRNNTATVTGIAASGTGNISGVLTNTTAAAVTVTFTITPVANGCSGTPVTATVLVNPATTVVATPASQTICTGGTIVPIVLTGVAGTTFTWTRDNTATVPGGIPASGSGNTITGFMLNTTNAPVTVTFTITPSANGCPGTPTTATVLVNPLASATATPATQTTCSGSAITTIALTSNVAGATYTWTRDNTAAATGIAASGTGNIAGALTLVGTVPVMVTFTITPSFGGCAGVPIIATVTINPTPTVNQPANQTLCNGSSTAAVPFTGSLAGVTYSWVNNTPSIGLAASGTGDIASFTATNAGITPVTATITVTPSINGCTGTPKTFTITVNPTATVNAVTSQTLCTGAATTAITFAGTVTGTTYSWTNSTPSIGLAAGGTGNIASFTAINNTPAAVTATITVTPTATGCAGSSKSFTITVNGQSVAPTGATASNIALCGPGTADLSVQGGALGTGASWKWYSGSCGGTLIGTGATITAVPVSGTATFYVRAEGTCNTTACASVTVTVNPQPTISLSASPYTSLKFPMVTGITATITPSAASNTIVWFKDGVLISGATTNVLNNITVDQLGTYSARVTTAAGCVALSAPLAIKDSASDRLFILPNPNSGQFKIRYYTSNHSFGFLRTVTIYDSKGARVYTNAIPVTGSYSIMDIDIRKSGKGVFLVVVGDSDGKELITGKVVVQ